MALLYSATLSFDSINCMGWHRCRSTLHESLMWHDMIWYDAILEQSISDWDNGTLYSCKIWNPNLLAESWSRLRTAGPETTSLDEPGCIRFQFISRGAFRFNARPDLQAEGATPSSYYMLISMQLSATHDLQSATQKQLNGQLSCTELSLSCGLPLNLQSLTMQFSGIFGPERYV